MPRVYAWSRGCRAVELRERRKRSSPIQLGSRYASYGPKNGVRWGEGVGRHKREGAIFIFVRFLCHLSLNIYVFYKPYRITGITCTICFIHILYLRHLSCFVKNNFPFVVVVQIKKKHIGMLALCNTRLVLDKFSHNFIP